MRPAHSFTTLSAALTLLMGTVTSATASQPKGLADLPDPSVDAEQKAFVVPEGYEINLWAAEPLLRKPVQMNWDSKGRLWVVCSTTYPQIKPGEEAIDQVVILEDTDNDGKADKSTLFADDLHIPTAVLPANGGCYVANSTEILFLRDTDGDGKADQRQVVLSGFGTEDTHHLVHTLRHGPDGQIHFNQSIYIHSHIETPWGVRRLMGGGIWEYQPETQRLEIIAKGLINPWGHEFDRWGQSFATDGAGSEGINFIYPGAVFKTSPGAKRVLDGLNPGQPKQCGLEIVEDPHFPDDWQDTLITCDFRGNRINRFKLSESGSSYVSKQLPDVLASTHRGFRPIDARTGSDGALYIADWFNPIIQHGEVDFRDPRRDRVNGRIWRLTAKGRPLTEKVDFSKMTLEELVKQLESPRRWNRQFATLEMRERMPQEAIALLNKIREEALPADLATVPPQQGETLLHLAWAREALNVHSAKWTRLLLTSPDPRVRAAGLRILSHHLDKVPDALKLLENAVADESAQVRLWAVACLRLMSKPEAFAVALRALDKQTPVDNNIDFLLELTAREQADIWLPVFLAGKLKLDENPKHLVYALKSTGKPEALEPLLTAYLANKLAPEDAETVLAMVGDFGSPKQLGAILTVALERLGQNAPVSPLLASLQRAAQRGGIPEGAAFEQTKKLLDSANPGFRAQGAQLAGLWKQEPARELLTQWAQSAEADMAVRVASVRGLVSLGGEASRTLLDKLSQDPSGEVRAQLGIIPLSDLTPSLAAKRAVEFLGTVKSPEDAKPVLEAFLRNKKLPAVLAKELEGKTIPEAAAIEGIRLASSKGLASLIEDSLRKAGQIKQMDKPLTPEEMTAMVAKVQKLGDAARGEKVYRRQQLLCISCHAIGGSGGVIGPDMVSIGASAQVDYLIESILNPTAKIKEGYHMTMVTTKDGRVVAGGVAQDGSDELVIRDAANQMHKVAKADIAQKTISPVSMMPPGLTASLREDEFLDLVRFLSELGREGPYKTPANPYIRTWRTMGVMEQADVDHVRHVGLFALNDRAYKYPWEFKTSLVSGDLPLAEMPVPVKMYPWFPRIAQADLEMPAAGQVKLKLTATKGIVVTVGEKVIQEVTEELPLELPAGKSTVTFILTREAGELPGFKVEIVDGPAKVVTTP
ncbi:putative membrane-bound dehydrogenase-like protein [Roseimicrobium gellanilyticum]|uniref:Putative membrane-bound dehydrogenase-like protein n=1 Tax=Roseimicrobium gellanilyticum TaxID=748857 RepID=A0A366HNJ5_9BACT|nr:PVC-type heme-binding CxxCH protein [Roseimicrobium gellanilyticum]RBP43936.1 putative membrane-bound dehydrogenase-like protein [Roseimicrobium gellanilyticum]